MKMYLKYLRYVIIHKWFVFFACCQVSYDWRYQLKLIWFGIIHDISKFLPSEFIPYARYFYGNYHGDKKDDIKRSFDRAWLKHIHRNPHHWQHWLLQEDDGDLKLIPIPIKYMLEMVSDWAGAGRAITGQYEISEWYEKNKDNIKINNIGRRFVEMRTISLEETLKNQKHIG